MAEPQFLAPSVVPGLWATPVVALLAAGTLLVLGMWVGIPRGAERTYLWLSGLAVGSRAFVPHVLLHTQTDDMSLVAFARGGSIEISHNAGEHGWAASLIRLSFRAFGESGESAHYIAQFFGSLIPSVTWLLGTLVLLRADHARLAAILVLLSPVALFYSGGISMYLPASVLFAAALVLSARGAEVGVVRGASLSLGACGALTTAAFLKPELALLVPAYAGWYVWLTWLHPKPGVGRSLGAHVVWVLPIVVAVVALLSSSGYVTAFSGAANGRIGGMRSEKWLTIPLYLTVGFFVLNPPVTPFKILFVGRLRSALRTRSGIAFLHTVAFAGLYVLSNQWVGRNQWRHALVFLVPFYVAVAPAVQEWLEEWRSPSRRWMNRSYVVLTVVIAALYALQIWNPRQREPRLLREANLDERSLVLFADHPSDESPRAVLLAVGGFPVSSLGDLWPRQCPAARALEGAARMEPPTRNGAGGEVTCARAEAATRAWLGRYDRLFLYVDSYTTNRSIVDTGPQSPAAYLRTAAEHLALEAPLAFDAPRLISVAQVAASGGDAPLWPPVDGPSAR